MDGWTINQIELLLKGSERTVANYVDTSGIPCECTNENDGFTGGYVPLEYRKVGDYSIFYALT